MDNLAIQIIIALFMLPYLCFHWKFHADEFAFYAINFSYIEKSVKWCCYACKVNHHVYRHLNNWAANIHTYKVIDIEVSSFSSASKHYSMEKLIYIIEISMDSGIIKQNKVFDDQTFFLFT